MDEGRDFPTPATQDRSWENQGKPARRGTGGVAAASGATFVTIATAARAAQSRVLARSVRRCYPDDRLVVVVADAAVPPSHYEDLYDVILPVEELSLDGLADMRFRCAPLELCAVLKPWVIGHLLDSFPGAPVYCLDPDIELFSPLAEADAALTRGANLVLIPRILHPALDQGRERAVLRSGSFDPGFVAVAPSADARRFVAWWRERARTGRRDDPPGGSDADENWLDLAPAICEGVAILRHPGYGFASWNADARPLSCLAGAWNVAGRPLRFVHHGKSTVRDQGGKQCLNRLFPAQHQSVGDLFAEYAQTVETERSALPDRRHDGGSDHRMPSGERVPEVVRNAYARHAPAVDGDLMAVLAHALSVLNAPSKARADILDLPISVLCDEIWQCHGDLRYRFDVDRENGRLAYLRWLVEEGAAELGIPAAFLDEARAAIDRRRVRELEEAFEMCPPSATEPAMAGLPTSADAIGGLIAARDAERERLRRQQADIRLLVASNKSLRREALSLRVQRWRDEETIAALDAELAQSRRALAELAAQPFWARLPLVARFRGTARPSPAAPELRELLEGEGPFFKRGFLVGETAAIAGATVRRIKNAPSGMMVFGPYVNLPAGRYVVRIDARLYDRFPLLTDFKVDVVCDCARRVIEARRFRLHALARRRRFEFVFSVQDGEDYPDFEIRIWARHRTPLEIGRIDVYALADQGNIPSPV